jgi:hypothetical protein
MIAHTSKHVAHPIGVVAFTLLLGIPAAMALSSDDQRSLRDDCIRTLVWGGFDDREQIFEAAETHLGEPELKPDEIAWITAEIGRQWTEKRTAEASWPAKTDWDRLDAVFSALDDGGIIALHDAGNTQSDSISDASEIWHDRGGENSKIAGFVYYHGQDVERVLETGELYIGYGAFGGDPAASLAVAQRAAAALSAAGFNVVTPTDAKQRILIKGITWQKCSPADE